MSGAIGCRQALVLPLTEHGGGELDARVCFDAAPECDLGQGRLGVAIGHATIRVAPRQHPAVRGFQQIRGLFTHGNHRADRSGPAKAGTCPRRARFVEGKQPAQLRDGLAPCGGAGEGVGEAAGRRRPSGLGLRAGWQRDRLPASRRVLLGDRREEVRPLLRSFPTPSVGDGLAFVAASHRLAGKPQETGELGVGLDAEGGLCFGEGRVHFESKSSVTSASQP